MVVLYLFLAVVALNCFYYLIFAKFVFTNEQVSHTEKPLPVSLIVCAKNEEANLKAHIPLWLEQDYLTFDLIFINDSSSDGSLEVMEAYAEKDSRIKIVNVKNIEAFWANKKYALTLGIKRSKYDHMVFTDADCRPASSQWLRKMVRHFSEEHHLVLGYGAYEKRPGMLNKLIRFETMLTAIQYFSYANAGIPYMGVGRNLAYTSTLYYENKGFMSHIKLPSGDDDLFVNEAATSTNTALCTSSDAFTYSAPEPTLNAWFRQKRRHLTTARYYKPIHKFLLGGYYVSVFLFWLLAGLTFLFTTWYVVLAFLLFRIILQYLILGKASKVFKESDLLPLIPVFEIFLIFTQLIIFITNSTTKTTHWK